MRMSHRHISMVQTGFHRRQWPDFACRGQPGNSGVHPDFPDECPGTGPQSCLHDLAHQCLFILKYHVSTALTAAARRHDILSRQARITDRFCRHSRHYTASIEFFHLLHLPIANGRSRVGKIVPRTKPLANGYVVPHICTGT